jgi:hypothetical protein
MNNFSALVGIIAGIISIALAVPTFLEHRRKGLSKTALFLMSTVIVVVIGAGLYFSTSATIIPHSPTNPFVSNATETPTATPSPTPTPIPVPTPKVIPINQTMSCTNCVFYTFSLMVRSATIDPAKSQVVLLIGLQNTSTHTLNVSFSFLKLQDLQTGLTTNGAGDGFDLTQITANQLILFRPTFPFIPVVGHEYSFSASLSTNGYAFSPITIKF